MVWTPGRASTTSSQICRSDANELLKRMGVPCRPLSPTVDSNASVAPSLVFVCLFTLLVSWSGRQSRFATRGSKMLFRHGRHARRGAHAWVANGIAVVHASHVNSVLRRFQRQGITAA